MTSFYSFLLVCPSCQKLKAFTYFHWKRQEPFEKNTILQKSTFSKNFLISFNEGKCYLTINWACHHKSLQALIVWISISSHHIWWVMWSSRIVRWKILGEFPGRVGENIESHLLPRNANYNTGSSKETDCSQSWFFKFELHLNVGVKKRAWLKKLGVLASVSIFRINSKQFLLNLFLLETLGNNEQPFALHLARLFLDL